MRFITQLFTHFTLAIAVVSGWSPSAAHAQRCEVKPPQPVALTLSGGVSLGAYQAGSLAYSALVFKANSEQFETKLVTGTSAGALNAFLTALATCESKIRLPSRSEFYRAWVGFDGARLLTDSTDKRGLFSKSVFQSSVSQVERLWQKGLPEQCDLVLGLSATRVKPLTEGSVLGSQRQSEKFTVRIRGRGEGRAPLITNYVNPTLFPRPLLLALTPGDDAQNFSALTKVLFASASFPLAFAPEELDSCLASPSNVWVESSKSFTCGPDEIERADFVDGGIYDNKPFALAERLSRTGLMGSDCGRPLWRTLPTDGAESQKSSDTAERLLYVYSDLNSTSYEKDQPKESRGALGVLSILLDSLLNASRSNDSQALLEQSPELKTQIAPLLNHVPRLGDSLWGFFGFYERDFRDFDFHLGVWEARELFKREKRFQKLDLTLPDFVDSSIDAKKLLCLDASYLRPAEANTACKDVGDENFATLVRLSVARLRAKRTDLEFALNFLADQNYTYRDLGLDGSSARQAPALIKRAAMKSVSELAGRQSFSEGFVVSAAGPLLLNMIEPLPTDRDFALSFGSQTEATVSTLIDGIETFRPRWTFGLALENTSSWLGSGSGRIVATPLIGLEFEPAKLNSNLLQTRLSIAAGYKFGEASRDSECREGSRLTKDCTGLSTRFGVSFTIIERLRFQTEVEAMPLQKTSPMPWRILPTLGLQFYF